MLARFRLEVSTSFQRLILPPQKNIGSFPQNYVINLSVISLPGTCVACRNLLTE